MFRNCQYASIRLLIIWPRTVWCIRSTHIDCKLTSFHNTSAKWMQLYLVWCIKHLDIKRNYSPVGEVIIIVSRYFSSFVIKCDIEHFTRINTKLNSRSHADDDTISRPLWHSVRHISESLKKLNQKYMKFSITIKVLTCLLVYSIYSRTADI